MQIVLDSSRVAVFFGDVGSIRLEANGCYVGPFFNPTHNSSNCELIDVEPPEFLVVGVFKRENDSWAIADIDAYDRARIDFIKRHNAEAREKRKAAYQTESDPIFFRYQRGECPKHEWEAKVIEIKNRYPTLEDPTLPPEPIPVAEFT